jgi:hypothetical protein
MMVEAKVAAVAAAEVVARYEKSSDYQKKRKRNKNADMEGDRIFWIFPCSPSPCRNSASIQGFLYRVCECGCSRGLV